MFEFENMEMRKKGLDEGGAHNNNHDNNNERLQLLRERRL
jgi:hypothetical protein